MADIDDVKTAKQTLRRSLLQTRKQMSPELWRQSSDRLCLVLQSWPVFAQAKTILAYCSIRQEPDLSPLFQDVNRQWGLPRCDGDMLRWHHWSPYGDWPLVSGAFGIQEPHPNSPLLEPDEIDLILVPAVACDYQGYRLGYGAGFYDRLFSSPLWATKVTVGIVFDFARVPQVSIDPWDVSLTAVCTEAGVFMV